VVIIDKELAQFYLDEFDRRWIEAAEPDQEDMGCK